MGHPTTKSAISDPRQKLTHQGFREALTPLVRDLPPDYDIDQTAELIIAALLASLD